MLENLIFGGKGLAGLLATLILIYAIVNLGIAQWGKRDNAGAAARAQAAAFIAIPLGMIAASGAE